ncbi:MAG: thioredoxin fold domain-containing protein [Burkholderiales bacterium]|nr:thioredoxin fold domain-containing protein [Burkholderiales bacterium]
MRFFGLMAATVLALAFAAGARAQQPSPFAIDVPPWFALSFLDFREDVADAARDGKRVMIYFGQDGCPYCAKLMSVNFSQPSIVAKTRKAFVPVALNLWGDREVTWIDGRRMSEKELGPVLEVQFTPTLLFLDEKGKIVARLNGYWPPQRFEAVLDYVAGRREAKETLGEYLAAAAKPAASATLHDEPFFMKPPYDFSRGTKPLAVLFETADCEGCDELHRDAFRRGDVLALIARYDVARFAIGSRAELRTPAGVATTAQAWARELGVTYAPTIVLFDGTKEVLRLEASLRPFHLSAALDYAASGAYRGEPSFQRYLQARTEAMRKRGERVDLME